ncbi:MAG: toxin-antitoxin system YwqK family antitoxin [Bacteroidota bacterium]
MTIRIILLCLVIMCGHACAYSQVYTTYRFNKKIKREVELFPDSNMAHVVFYYPDGSKSVDAWYNNDTLHGKTIEWYKSGQIKLMGNYKRGLRSGKWKYWYSNGKIQSQQYFVNGQPDDWYFSWYSNGNMKEKGYYVSGKPEGEWKEWYSNGSIREEGKCKWGQKEGLWVEYYMNSREHRQTYYIGGVPYTETIFFWSNGKLDVASQRELERIINLPESDRTEGEKVLLKHNMKYFRRDSRPSIP